MQVKEIVDLICDLIFASSPNQQERAFCLRFLNKAYKKAYGNLSDCLITIELRKLPVLAGNNYATFSREGIFAIGNYVGAERKQLLPGFISQIDNLPNGYYVEYQDTVYFSKSEKLPEMVTKDGKNIKYINQHVVATPKKLVEEVEDPSKETNIPIFDEKFHGDLVEAAMEYLCLAHKTYLEKYSLYAGKIESFHMSLKQHYLAVCPYRLDN